MKIEENILIENKQFSFVFSRDYLHGGLYIDVYDKEGRELLVKDYEIKKLSCQNRIMEKISQEPGKIIRCGKMKFIVKNHDKVYDDIRGNNTYYHSTINNVYDTRNTTHVPLLSRIIPFLKELWVTI